MRLREAIDFVGIGRAGDRGAFRRILTVDDLRSAARRALPRSVFDYVEGGSDRELALTGNEAAFRGARWLPRQVQDVASIDTGTTIAGDRWALPLGLAPTGYTRMIDPAGEVAVARAARTSRIPYVLSTVGSTTIEDVTAAAVAPWSQLYAMKDRDLTDDLVRRAVEAGSPVLEIAVDTAVSGNRLRDRRNGLTIPPKMTLSTLTDIGMKPRYWTRMLRHEAMDFAQVRASDRNGVFAGGSIADIGAQFDPSLSWDDVARIRSLWPRTLLLKGAFSPDEARRARDAGVDGVHLSNHGGRQLDQHVAPISLVAPVRAALGRDAIVIVDSGVRSGGDVAVAIASGADAAFVGRPYLWALAVGGEAGVEHLADILGAEYRRTLALLGATSTAELRARGPELLRGA
ncbi:alpha-hydroxy-acid oxidizing enzyme [Rathayibacter sp. VKM Ac-2803]|uniref:alpha-hydroxy acid oxidase n=1 Tax=Rathayibacter sp. VKM Ac-2803 TaxID=2609256 RepID=UPI00135C2014|nr:alpha-hydroxy acid oxidase [Rathayibacter sp. VKM Ac-2803]MWV48542.1 alpha-hydroxy-acid oxidizing enzyme [Rathayibacter sp. VKM Ac-2803]